MKLKYYLRGLGTGILFATVILFIAYAYRMSDKQIKERAKELGMVFPDKEVSTSVDTTTKEVASEDATDKETVENSTNSDETVDETVEESTLGEETKESASDKETEESTTKEKTTEETTTKEETTEETTTKEETTEETTTKSDKPVKSYVLKVTSKTISRDVAKKLEANGIIDDAEDFNDYLCENDYASNIQNGKFTLKSNMSYKEIAEIITSKPTEE